MWDEALHVLRISVSNWVHRMRVKSEESTEAEGGVSSTVIPIRAFSLIFVLCFFSILETWFSVTQVEMRSLIPLLVSIPTPVFIIDERMCIHRSIHRRAGLYNMSRLIGHNWKNMIYLLLLFSSLTQRLKYTPMWLYNYDLQAMES